jgi:hypothetical protein
MVELDGLTASALGEMVNSLRICLDHDGPAADGIFAVSRCAELGGTRYMSHWQPLAPHLHYFTSFLAAAANAMLFVDEQYVAALARDEVRLADLLVGVSALPSTDADYYNYAVVIGYAEKFRHATLGDAVSAAIRDAQGIEQSGGF